MSWTYQRRVKYYETDRMGVVHHSNYLRLLEDARMDWLGENIMNYREIEKMGIIIPTVSAKENFRGFLRYDDPFTIEMKLVEYTGVRMRFTYKLYNSDTGKLCYEGETTEFFSTDAQRTGKEYTPISIKHKAPELHQKFLAMLEPEEKP